MAGRICRYLLPLFTLVLAAKKVAGVFNPLSNLNSIEDLLTCQACKEQFPNLKDEIAKFSLEDVQRQLALGDQNEDKKLNATELMKKYGYKTETHFITTEDGYIISMYRIPSNAEPVLLVHGLTNSAVDWLTLGPYKGLAYYLADNGYDVWMLNARGTIKQSEGHVKLSAEKDPKLYWNFSWDEIGYNDLPASVDYILNKTNHSKIKYVGHSQGTTSFFVFCSRRPEYNDKISLMVALSPVAWMSHAISPLVRLVAPFEGPLAAIIKNVLGVNKLTPDNILVQILTKIICGETALATLICDNIYTALVGFNYDQLNVTNLPVIFGHTPSGVALKQIYHYGQAINSGKFRRYDYGAIENLARYGAMTPPDYPVHKITAPVALFYRNDSDWLSSQIDVNILRGKLSNVIDYFEIPYEKFRHTDYVWGNDARKLVYERVLKLIIKYGN